VTSVSMQPSKSPRASWLWHLYVVVFTVATGLFLAWLSNKLLVDEVVKRAMTRIYAPLLSLNYPDSGQRNITVVTLDDTDLKEYGLNWPVPLDYYQRLIDGVVKRQPKAIFLDVVFLDDKPEREVNSLIGAVCRATEAGVPFFMATFARGALSSNAERRLFDARTAAGAPCALPVRSNVTPDSLDQSQWAYPLRPRVEDEEIGRTDLPDSVALSIYCRLYASNCPKHTEVPLALIWATQAAPTNVETMVTRNAQGALTPVCRGVWNWWEVIPGADMFFRLAGHPKLPLCLYNQVLPVRAFKGQGFSPQELHEALAGKVVMIGADLKAVGDNAFSPLHGRIPGVHVHAMALDNLISFGGQYRANGDFEWHEGWHSPANRFIFLSLMLTASVMVFWKRRKEHTTPPDLSNQAVSRGDFTQWPVVLRLQSAGARHPHSGLMQALVAGSLAGLKLLVRLPMVVALPLLLVTGWPRLGSTEQSRHALKQSLWGVLIYLALGGLVFYLGYYVFFQGPLSIIEYVLFPLMSHFLHLGELFADRSRQLWLALRASNPWAEWARQGGQASDGH
jgi:CHASE2 domain